MQQVLPTLQRLSEDSDSAVQTAAIDGLAQLLPWHGSNPEMAGRLYSHFDELVTSNQPDVRHSLTWLHMQDSYQDACFCVVCPAKAAFNTENQ